MSRHIPVFLNISTKDPRWAEIAVQAEAACLDAIVLSEGPAEPTVALARLAAVTRRIGLIGTFSATYNDPLELARRLADLDYLSGGRVGWRIAPDQDPGSARSFGARRTPDAGQNVRRRNELVESVLARWDERTELRSPQGHPVLLGPADAVSSDVVLLEEPDAAVRGEIRSRAAFLGRGPDSVRVLSRTRADVPVEQLEELVRQESVDGFSFRSEDAWEFFSSVLPGLKQRGLVREHYRSGTLRAHLDLAVPARRPFLAGLVSA